MLEDAVPSNMSVIADLGADSYADVPLCSWTFINGGQFDYGLWQGTLAISLLVEPDDYETLLSDLYAAIHAWDHPEGGIDTINKVAIESVTDTIVFDFTNAAIVNSKSVMQFNGQFALMLRDFS
ncbi:hypothetical protein ACSHWG_00900 [Leucobacter sp. Z1108]|uniref:hypothetical protein n=1 Tax=Leucobacter sp. Z1108 TaxID=3439066 RepID=UPI003F362545